jgi:hypothetical protein
MSKVYSRGSEAQASFSLRFVVDETEPKTVKAAAKTEFLQRFGAFSE